MAGGGTGTGTGNGGGNWSGTGSGYHAPPPTDDPNVVPAASKLQPGLVRPEDNPTGRRMRAVFMGAEDIVGTLQARLMALAMFRSLGNRLRQVGGESNYSYFFTFL